MHDHRLRLRPVLLAALLACGASGTSALAAADSAPISLHPDNPHYLLFRGRPTVLVTSGEHYGAVLNLDFDYVKYLDALASDGLNLTRLFSGTYREVPGNFKIQRNTLAPAEGRYACPWARSGVPGYAHGGAKFDLRRFDPAYFARLRDFCGQAARRGIVVEVVLFCPLYRDSMWNVSPMKASNNVNRVGDIPRTECLTLRHKDLVAVQEALVRKVVGELGRCDNVYYEICNEPYFGGVTMAWQHRMAGVIAEAERGFAHRHLVAQNIANKHARIADPHPSVSIFNFHYAVPAAVADNFHLGKALGDDETGFRGPFDAPYLAEAWGFMISGGGIFSNLDYSFAAGWEDGTFPYPSSQPGAGSPRLRRQLRVLKTFLESFEFVKMRPDPSVKGVFALVEPGRQYAVYGPERGKAFELKLPAGRYDASWLDVETGRVEKHEAIDHAGAAIRLRFPGSAAALRLVAPGVKGRADLASLAAVDTGRLCPDGLAFRWRAGSEVNPLRDASGKHIRQCRVWPHGAAKLGPTDSMEPAGGLFLADLRSCDALLEACHASNELTIEAVITPANVTQTGPARIVSFSTDTGRRNFTLGQDGEQLVLRLRTPATGPNGVNPQAALCKIEAGKLVYVAVTYRDGKLTTYVGGKQVSTTGAVRGDFRNWEPARLVFGNEYGGGDRKWLGRLHWVRLWSRAVDEKIVPLIHLNSTRTKKR